MRTAHIVRDDLTLAYLDALRTVVERRAKNAYGLMIEVEKPLTSSVNTDNEHNLSGLNINSSIHKLFESFTHFDGKTGKSWIENRIDELFTGLYYRAIHTYNQLDFVEKVLKKILHSREVGKYAYTWCSNRLFCLTFNHSSNNLSHLHLSRQPIPPCLTLVDFKPEQTMLHLLATWRAQYFDTKAYGNLLSLAILLRNVCRNTGFHPGHLISTANKAIVRNGSNAKRLLQLLETKPSLVWCTRTCNHLRDNNIARQYLHFRIRYLW